MLHPDLANLEQFYLATRAQVSAGAVDPKDGLAAVSAQYVVDASGCRWRVSTASPPDHAEFLITQPGGPEHATDPQGYVPAATSSGTPTYASGPPPATAPHYVTPQANPYPTVDPAPQYPQPSPYEAAPYETASHYDPSAPYAQPVPYENPGQPFPAPTGYSSQVDPNQGPGAFAAPALSLQPEASISPRPRSAQQSKVPSALKGLVTAAEKLPVRWMVLVAVVVLLALAFVSTRGADEPAPTTVTTTSAPAVTGAPPAPTAAPAPAG